MRADGALVTPRCAGLTDIPTMKHHRDGKENPFPLRHEPQQIAFDTQRISLSAQAEAVRESRHMSVHDDSCGDTESRAQDHVGCLSADARQCYELLHIGRYQTAVMVHESLRTEHKRSRLGAEKTSRVDHLFEVCWSGAGQSQRGRIGSEQPWRHLINARIGALCRQDGCYQQLKGRAVRKLHACLRAGLVQPAKNRCGPVAQGRCLE